MGQLNPDKDGRASKGRQTAENPSKREAHTVQLSWKETNPSPLKWQIHGESECAKLDPKGQAGSSVPGNLPFQHHGQRHITGKHYDSSLARAQHPATQAFCTCLCPPGPRASGTGGQGVCEAIGRLPRVCLCEYLSPPCVRSSL